MFRIVKLTSKWYALNLGDKDFQDVIDNDPEVKNVTQFLYEGQPVIFVHELEEFAEVHGVDINEIQIIEPNETED